MEAIPLSEMSAVACAKALTFTWISRFGVPETITSDRGPQFTSDLCPNFARCLTSHTNKQQLTTLSRTAQSKDCTTTSRTRFTHAPPRQHHLRIYPLYFSDSKHSRGKTLVFPQLRQFLVLQLCCQINFCKMISFQLTLLSKCFPKLCMFLLLLCLGTILAPSCPASCQPSCSPPPWSGSFGVESFYPFSSSTTAPTPFCAMTPAPSASESGHGTRSSPSVTRGRHTWQPTSLQQAAGFAPRRPCLIRRPAVFLSIFSGAATKRSPNRFPTQQGGFCMPGTGGTFTASTDAVTVSSTGTTQEVGPLTSSPSS
jgi:hypothetical protein